MLFLPFLEDVYDGISSTTCHLSTKSASFNPLASLFHPKLVSTGVATSPGPLKPIKNTSDERRNDVRKKNIPSLPAAKTGRFFKRQNTAFDVN